MIPNLVTVAGSPWEILPPGIHDATLAEVGSAFVYNRQRRFLFDGLIYASATLAMAGCRTVLLDGSFVSSKPIPGDYDACWEPDGIDFDKLDRIFGEFDDGRASQKARFGGEFFPSTLIAAESGRAFVEFFQTDRFTGNRKGILSLSINTDESVLRRMKL
jgi:hypothetical protein